MLKPILFIGSQNNKMKKEKIEVNIYFTNEKGNVIIDEKSMKDEFESKLIEVLQNPKDFVYWEYGY